MPSMSQQPSSSPQSELEREGLTWLLVVGVGFVFGFGWVSGPLGWYFGKKLRRQAEATRTATPDVVRFAHIGGIVTTIITYIGLVIVVAVVVAGIGFALVAAPDVAYPRNQ